MRMPLVLQVQYSKRFIDGLQESWWGNACTRAPWAPPTGSTSTPGQPRASSHRLLVSLSLKINFLCLKLFIPLLRIRDVYTGSQLLICLHPESRTLDLGCQIQKQQKEQGGKIICLIFFVDVSLIFTKFEINLFLNRYRKTLANRQRNKVFFTLECY